MFQICNITITDTEIKWKESIIKSTDVEYDPGYTSMTRVRGLQAIWKEP